MVNDKENVLVMFAGVGPFAIEIAKHKKAKVAAIELNKDAYRYMIKNIEINKVNVEAVLGDVKEVVYNYKDFADRIVMPLPKDSYNFLDSCLIAAKDKCIVHYYAFGKIDNAFDEHFNKIKEFMNKNNADIELISKRVVRPYSASEIEIVIDFLIKKRK